MKTAFTLFIICFFSYSSFAQPGTLDSSFGDKGVTLTPITNLVPNFVASSIDSEENIYLAGSYTSIAPPSSGFLVSKYSSEGILDTAFGRKGFANVNNVGDGEAIAIQPDNKIIVAGYYVDWLGPIYFTICRFNTNGSLDKTFGKNGVVRDNAGSRAFAISIQSDSKILVSGYAVASFVTIRYMPDGTHDSSFGNNGVVTNFINNATVHASTIQPDRKILTAGDNAQKIMLARYNSDGSMDESFGSFGTVSMQFTNPVNHANDMVLQSDGKIITAGSASNGITYDVFLVRYLSNGIIDSTFGINGTVTKKLQYNSLASCISLQKDGKIVISGQVYDVTGSVHSLTERFILDGTLDSTFGEKGIVITKLVNADIATGQIIQPTGKIVITGYGTNTIDNNTLYYATLARFNNDLSQKQIIIKKIKHYMATHNNAEATSLNSVSIYPNPAQNELHVAGLSSSNKTKLTVIDFMGNAKLQAVVNTSSFNLNIVALTPGNYLLKIEMNDAIVTKKFVKE